MSASALAMGALSVYGTVRRGARNHRLPGGTRRLGSCGLGPGLRMPDLGGCPGVIEANHGGVRDEVHRVPVRVWSRPDCREQSPRGYTRKLVATPFRPARIHLLRGRAGRGRRFIPGANGVAR